MYVRPNFRTKKALRQAVIDHWLHPETFPAVTIFEPGLFGGTEPRNGTVAVEGPHYPKPHKWYAEVTIVNGKVTHVK